MSQLLQKDKPFAWRKNKQKSQNSLYNKKYCEGEDIIY